MVCRGGGDGGGDGGGRGWGVVYVTGLGSFLPIFTLSIRYLLVCYTHVFSCIAL